MSSVYMVMPFDYEYNFKNWAVMHSINVYCISLGSLLMAVFDTANYAMIFHLIGHVEIFKHNLKTFSEKCENGNLVEADVRRGLIELIEYHSFVIK